MCHNMNKISLLNKGGGEGVDSQLYIVIMISGSWISFIAQLCFLVDFIW